MPVLSDTEADFVAMGAGDGTSPRTEIVVRHAERGSTEVGSHRGACLDDPKIDVPLRTGFNGSLACRCRVHPPVKTSSVGSVQFANCDDSG